MPTTVADLFNPMSATFTADRFRLMAELRAQAPAVFVPGIGMWAVTGYQAVKEVLSDETRFPASGGYSGLRHLSEEARAVYPIDGPMFTYALISTDDPLHKRLRAPLTAAFTARRIRAVEEVVAADAQEIAARLFDQGDVVDMYEGFCRQLPPRTICRIFGLPVTEAPKFSSWSMSFIALQVPGLPVNAQVKAMTDIANFDSYVRAIVTGDLSELSDGIIRSLIERQRAGGNDLTEDEMVGNIANVLFAGHETTVSTMANILVRLLGDHDRWANLASGSVDLGPLLEELLRVDTSVMGLFRRTENATQIDGVDVPANAPLWVAFGAANRDPTVYDQPDEMIPERPRTRDPLTWGHGAHVCVGRVLAQLQLRIALTILPRDYPTLHLLGDVLEVPNHLLRISAAVPASR